MKSHFVVAALVSAVVLAPAAFAGNASSGPTAKSSLQLAAASPSAQCTALEGQWQKDGMGMKTNAKFSTAQKLASQGEQLCNNGKSTDGAAKLTQALHELGLKPKA